MSINGQHILAKWQNTKNNLQNSVAFLYTNHKHAETENMETLLFTIASKKYKLCRNKPNQRGERLLQ